MTEIGQSTQNSAVTPIPVLLSQADHQVFKFAGGASPSRCPLGSAIILFGDQLSIGEVTRESIEIIGPPPRETRTRFYNPDVDQPWIRRVEPR